MHGVESDVLPSVLKILQQKVAVTRGRVAVNRDLMVNLLRT
jgi:hypothetical protein